ncbi:hypothetical protein PENSUB_5709 [Penicillium subrubescens]|uniref:Transcription factor domain-containing protein n=1 Tax=Penicillium subrubescens TaxID=1316194 RepID=A0A1Q5U779_9EURO|nr:hypothetical protein PENSUB_5709 [Penicillium subrubescens]
MPGKKWIAVFNQVLGIGAELHNMSRREERIDSSTFLARAQTVNSFDYITGAHEDLQEVQAQTLAALYFLITSNIDRSSGLGENSSMAPLPLEFCSEVLSPNQLWERPPQNRSIRWTIYQKQDDMANQRTLLQSLTPSHSLFQFYLVDLDLITHTIANRVFGIDIFQDGWSDIERRIAYYNVKMDLWQSDLHSAMQFADDQGRPRTGSLSAFQAILALQSYSARIVLNRPCFKRFGNKKEVQFPSSSFGGQTASNCLHASLKLISLLPDLPDMDWYFLIGPWWSLLHFVVQALTILLIHLSLGPGMWGTAHEGIPELQDSLSAADVSGTILAAAGKALLWLSSLRKINRAASRAFDRCYACLQLVAVTKAIDLGDMARDSPFSNSPASNLSGQESSGKASNRALRRIGGPIIQFLLQPFASFGPDIDIHVHTSDPANTTFEDILASLMETAP